MQAKRIAILEESVKVLCNKFVEEQERGIKLESRCRRNNLNFFNILRKKMNLWKVPKECEIT